MATPHWVEGETKALISVWGSEEVQSLLNGAVRNKAIYERISRELAENGVERSWKQCRDRIKNLLTKYRKTKDKNNQTGNNRHNCPFYNEIDSIIGTRPVCVPPVVMESSMATVDKHEQPSQSIEEKDLEYKSSDYSPQETSNTKEEEESSPNQSLCKSSLTL